MVLLIVDIQELIVTKELYLYEKFMSRVKQLIDLARTNKVEVIYARHEDGIGLTKGREGFDICKEIAPEQNEKIFDKHYNSAFRGTGLAKYLKSKKEDTIMIAGLLTDYCIDATIKCGFEHGFTMIVPADCNTTEDNEYMTGKQSYQYFNEMMWNQRYARCVSFEDASTMF